jgi:hypothetical protein
MPETRVLILINFFLKVSGKIWKTYAGGAAINAISLSLNPRTD